MIKLAWRNIWRNRTRTLITISSIFFAVFLALLMRSMQEGSYGHMIKMSVGKHTGYIQIHDSGYWENKSINRLMDFNPDILQKVKSQKNTNYAVPRFEAFALMASDSLNKGAALIGIDPKQENQMNHLANRLIEGHYLTQKTEGVLIAEGLAKYLKLSLNDTIVMLGQGYHGANAVGKYPITGIVKFTIPQQNNGVVYMPLHLTQKFFSADDKITSLSLVVYDISQINTQKIELQKLLGNEFEVMRWQELQPELVQSIESDKGSGLIMLFILYTVVGFGIFGTVLMMTMERRKEFGVLVAVGMQKWKLAILVFWETMFLGILGILMGCIFTTPILYFFYIYPIQIQGESAEMMLKMGYEPILPFALKFDIFWKQGVAVFLMTLLCWLYPLMTIKSLTVIKALKR